MLWKLRFRYGSLCSWRNSSAHSCWFHMSVRVSCKWVGFTDFWLDFFGCPLLDTSSTLQRQDYNQIILPSERYQISMFPQKKLVSISITYHCQIIWGDAEKRVDGENGKVADKASEEEGGRHKIPNLSLLVWFSNGQGVNMKALILCVMRLALWKREGQLEREGEEGWREVWREGGKNEEVTFAGWGKERGTDPAEKVWEEKGNGGREGGRGGWGRQEGLG